MNKIEEIFKSWNIAINPNQQQHNLAVKRLEICNSCEYKKTVLGINQCSVCGCALKGKVFSPQRGTCPKGKWNVIDNLMERVPIKNDKGLEIFKIPNFLSSEECDHIIDLTEKSSHRSRVAATSKEASSYTEGRTSSTSVLSDHDIVVNEINNRMHNELGIPFGYSEPTQGQIYEVGQEFRHHYDYFSEYSYNNYCLHSGQRTWTFMIYLNGVEEGGETDFSEIGARFVPEKGTAVVWKNSSGKGTENTAALHAGMPVIKGKKIIITKWFRENIFNSTKDAELANLKNKSEFVNKSLYDVNQKTFKTLNDLPRLSPYGFKVVKVPEKTFSLILEAYNLLQHTIRKENWQGINSFIYDDNGNSPVEIMSMDAFTRIREIIAEELQPLHEEFISHKEAIVPKWIYGIRSYKNGAMLKPHTDTLATHHISSVIIVDKKVNKDWALDIQDHKGNWHKVYANAGEMILYESATNMHGRIEPFDGEYFRNFFLHYTFKDYKLV
jgi:prolyl 4-hydroxylase